MEIYNKILNIIVRFVVVLLTVAFVLPIVFVLLGGMWPTIFKGTVAIQALKDNVDSIVGVISLFVGLFSIAYTWMSNKVLDSQKLQQDEFLHSLDEKVSEIKTMVKTNSDEHKNIFDRIESLKGVGSMEPGLANEE